MKKIAEVFKPKKWCFCGEGLPLTARENIALGKIKKVKKIVRDRLANCVWFSAVSVGLLISIARSRLSHL